MEIREGLRYSREHEWLRPPVGGQTDGGHTVGITDFAQDALGDVVYVELPAPGSTVEAGAVCCEVESTKSVSDIYAPISGTIATVNERLAGEPELINSDPYGEGWIFSIKSSEDALPETLLDSQGYAAFLAQD